MDFKAGDLVRLTGEDWGTRYAEIYGFAQGQVREVAIDSDGAPGVKDVDGDTWYFDEDYEVEPVTAPEDFTTEGEVPAIPEGAFPAPVEVNRELEMSVSTLQSLVANLESRFTRESSEVDNEVDDLGNRIDRVQNEVASVNLSLSEYKAAQAAELSDLKGDITAALQALTLAVGVDAFENARKQIAQLNSVKL